jgi:CheY-like chemotaxis protein/PAS domain-containing protein
MAGLSSWSREGAQLLSQEHKIRLVLVLLLALFVVLAGGSLAAPRLAQLGVLLMLAALLLSRYGVREGRRLSTAQGFHLAAVALTVLDVAAVTLFLFGTGAAGSGFFSLYLISLVFAAIFFRGLELALLTLLAALLYAAVFWSYPADPAWAWHLAGRLIGLVVVASYVHALAEAIRRENSAHDQLLNHLTEGVLVFDDSQHLTLVNGTMLSLLGDRQDAELVGSSRDRLAAAEGLLAWAVADVGAGAEAPPDAVRVGSFPEAGLPLVECLTISCGAGGGAHGWIVVCKDLRDQTVEPRSPRSPNIEKLSPLTSLRSLTQSLYSMAEYMEEGTRGQAIEAVHKHTRALQAVLTEMLHDSYDEPSDTLPLDLSFVEIPSLVQGTRRVLEITSGAQDVPVEIIAQEALPNISADRGALGQSLLQLGKGLLGLAGRNDKLIMDVRATDGRVRFTLELVGATATTVSAGDHGHALSAAEAGEFFEGTEAFSVIEQHGGSWECVGPDGTVRRVVLELPVEGPRKSGVGDLEERAAARRELAEIAADTMKLDPALAAQVSNELKNALNVIRGYAELALKGQDDDRKNRALELAISLSDEAASLVDSLHPAGGQFPREETPTPPAPADVAKAPTAAPAPPRLPVSGTILLVDDDAAMRQLLADTLEDAGYHTAAADDGYAALEYLQGTLPAMIFVDLSMPGLSGVDVMREVRQLKPDLPVVLMTGYAYNLAMQALGEEKPYAIVGKPFAISEVLNIANAFMGQKT